MSQRCGKRRKRDVGVARDPSTSLHFTCDGSIQLVTRLPAALFVPGDTATATISEDDEEPWIWRCVAVRPHVRWERLKRWTEPEAAPFINVANMLVIVADSDDPNYYRRLAREALSALRS